MTFVFSSIIFVIVDSFTDTKISNVENKLKCAYDVCENFGGPLSLDCDSVTCNDGKIVTVIFNSCEGK